METNQTFRKVLYRLLAVGIILGVWKLLTLWFDPMTVPTIPSVIIVLKKIISTGKLWKMIYFTSIRLIVGLCIGISLGLILGILMGHFLLFREVFSPIIGILQTVPPVSWVVLALVWFGFNGKPAVFIVVVATLPLIAISVEEGIRNIDGKLLQMAEVYRFSKQDRFKHIIFPSVMPYFHASFQLALGIGWKICVMGEVLTTNSGIGGMIKQGRMNVEPETIIAWSVVVVLLFYLSDFITNHLFFKGGHHAVN